MLQMGCAAAEENPGGGSWSAFTIPHSHLKNKKWACKLSVKGPGTWKFPFPQTGKYGIVCLIFPLK